jgi:hypothetical protein
LGAELTIQPEKGCCPTWAAEPYDDDDDDDDDATLPTVRKALIFLCLGSCNNPPPPRYFTFENKDTEYLNQGTKYNYSFAAIFIL